MIFNHRFFFARIERDQLGCAVVVTVNSKHAKPEVVLEKLRMAVTDWVFGGDADGKKLWKYSQEDLNIGDLSEYIDGFIAGDVDSKAEVQNTLWHFLKKRGFYAINLNSIESGEVVSYDRVLVDVSRLEEA